MTRRRPRRPPPPLQAPSAGGDDQLSLFLETDLGTHLALLVAADSTIRHLKSQVVLEHAAAFPDLGPVAVKSIQVRRKGEMYHLSDSMVVRSAFARANAGGFLHVKMAAAVTDTHCCSDSLAIEDRGRSSEGFVGVGVDKRIGKLPAMVSEIASDVFPQGLEVGEDAAVLHNVHARNAVPNDMLLPSSSQHITEKNKKEAVSVASDAQANSVPVINKAKSYKQRIKHGNQTEGAYVNSTSVANIDRSTNESNVSQVGEKARARKEDILHSNGDHDVGVVFGNKQVGIKDGTLEDIHALDDLSQEKKRKKARKTGSVDTSAADPIRETNESETRDVTKSDRVPLKTNTNSRGVPLETNTNSCGVSSSTSFQQEVHGNIQEHSAQLENSTISGKKKKRKSRLPVTSKEVVSAQEMTKPLTGAVEAPKAVGDILLLEDKHGLHGDGAYNVEMTSRDKARPSDVLFSSSQLNSGSLGTEHVQFVSDAQATRALVYQGNIDLVHKGYTNPTIGDTVNSTSEVIADEIESTKETIVPWDGEEKHSRKKQHIDNDTGHDEGVVETSNIHKGSNSNNVFEKTCITGNTSQEKKRKKAKKVSSADIASVDTAEEKDQFGYGENTAKSDRVSTQGESVNDPFKRHLSSNVHQGDSNAIENQSGDGKRKKKRTRHLESSKNTDHTHDVSKPSIFITNESSIQNTSAAPVDAKQTTPDTIGEATDSDRKKLDESLDVATTNVIDEVLADLRSTRSLSKDLDGYFLTEQALLGSNPDVLGLLQKTGDKGCVIAALPPKYPVTIHSDALISSPSVMKSKGKQLKVLSSVLEPSYSSGGVPEENANTELRESESLRCSDETSDVKDILVKNTVMQTEERTESTKRQRKKISLKHAPTDDGKAIQSSGEQVNWGTTEDLQGATKTDLVQEGSVIDTPTSTVGKVQQKSKRSSKTRTPKVQENNHSTHGQDGHVAKDNQDEYLLDFGGTNDKENAVGAPSQSPVVQKDATTLEYASPIARKGRKKSSKTEFQSQDSALEHGSDVDLMNLRETVNPKCSADAVEPNDYVAVHPDNDKINFIDHFSPNEMNDPRDSVEKRENNESTESTPRNANRNRVAVRKVPRKRYEQTSVEFKKDSSKRGTGAIFDDAISEGSDDVLDTMSEKAAMEISSDDSSISADSGISSASQDGSDVPDDDGIVSLSQKSLKDGLHIGSILRGSSSYKKARQKQTEQLDLDDAEVPDSQPADSLRL